MTQDTSQNKVELEERKEKDSRISHFFFFGTTFKYPKTILKDKRNETSLSLSILSQASKKKENLPPSEVYKRGVLLVRLASVNTRPGTKAMPLFESFA